MARPKIDDPRDLLSVRLLRSTLAKAEAIGQERGRSVRNVISDALEDYVKREEKKLKKLAKTG